MQGYSKVLLGAVIAASGTEGIHVSKARTSMKQFPTIDPTWSFDSGSFDAGSLPTGPFVQPPTPFVAPQPPTPPTPFGAGGQVSTGSVSSTGGRSCHLVDFASDLHIEVFEDDVWTDGNTCREILYKEGRATKDHPICEGTARHCWDTPPEKLVYENIRCSRYCGEHVQEPSAAVVGQQAAGHVNPANTGAVGQPGFPTQPQLPDGFSADFNSGFDPHANSNFNSGFDPNSMPPMSGSGFDANANSNFNSGFDPNSMSGSNWSFGGQFLQKRENRKAAFWNTCKSLADSSSHQVMNVGDIWTDEHTCRKFIQADGHSSCTIGVHQCWEGRVGDRWQIVNCKENLCPGSNVATAALPSGVPADFQWPGATNGAPGSNGAWGSWGR